MMSSTDPTPSSTQRLTILTYNVGLLQFKLFGVFEVFANPPYAPQRLPYILKALKAQQDVDILCIQECYSKTHVNKITKELKDIFPYSAHYSSGFSVLKFDNGLLILSKYPITDVHLDPYKKVSSREKHLANKSSLACTIDVPHFGKKVRVINMHTTAGGTAHPEHPEVDIDREDELKQAYDMAVKATQEEMIPMIVGDLNCGPEASASNYNYILQQSYCDTFLRYKETQSSGSDIAASEGLDVTWDPKNYLNEIGPHAHCPGQRCDHVLLPNHVMPHVQVVDAKIIFTETEVPIGGKKFSTMSDHYGLKIAIEVQHL